MEHLDPVETAKRILAGIEISEETVEETVDEIVVESEEDFDFDDDVELDEKVHGKKMKEEDDDDEEEDEVEEDYDVKAKKQVNAGYGMVKSAMHKDKKMVKANYGMKEAETVVDDEKYSKDTEGKGPMINKPTGDSSSKNMASVKAKPSKASGKVETPSMKEHVDALFNGEELSEDFKDKAVTIFEAAINQRVAETEAELTERYESVISEHTEQLTKELTEKLDDYLSYVVEQWMQENELAVETGIRADIAENFLSGLKGLFESNYIEVPEEKYDLVETLATEVVSLESQLQEELNYNIELKKQVESKTAEEIFTEVTEDLVDTDRERLQQLSEGIEFEDEETFRGKLNILKENYLSDTVVNETGEEIVSEEVQTSDSPMDVYAATLGRLTKNAKSNQVS